MNRRSRPNDLSALLVGEYEIDERLVDDVFKKHGWRLFEAKNRKCAMARLKHNSVQVVIAKTDVAHWSWRNILDDLRGLANPPQLIVTSRTADDSLWAEVLNIGGYDVMALPFEPLEMERVIASAFQHFQLPLSAAVSSKTKSSRAGSNS